MDEKFARTSQKLAIRKKRTHKKNREEFYIE